MFIDGRKMIDSVNLTDEPYEFSLAAIFEDADGNLYGANDSGCSCPNPFENHTESDLSPIRSIEEFNNWAKEVMRGDRNPADIRTEVNRLKGKVRRRLNKKV